MQWIKQIGKKVISRIPFLYNSFHKRKFNKRFQVESQLLAGTHVNTNKHKSIIHFSMNKAATQYVKNILQEAATANGMTPVSLNEFAFHSTMPFLDHLSAKEMEQYKHVFKPRGYLYSSFGGMIENIDNLEDYLIVLMIRDPRDILVSGYFSMAYSHPEPSKLGSKYEGFMEKRNKAQQTLIDEYVKAESPKVYLVFKRYHDLLLNNRSNVYVTKYEDMISDFQGWLTKLLNYTGLEISEDLKNDFINKHNGLKPKKENKAKHIRKGTSGDYKQKLNEETMQFLNTKFSDILEQYSYKY